MSRKAALPLIQSLLILGTGCWIYWPALHGGWLWDDAFDTQNPVTRSAQGLWSIWFAPGSQIDYYPVKATVQWMQWHLWGNETLGYHVTNLVLHLVNALLVWKLLHKLGLRLAWLGGLIFVIHPTAVESVAWIAELKNTLSLPPFLLAICFLLEYDQRGRRRDFLLAMGLFLLAMLTKPTMVLFPFVILLHAWWKRGRIDWNDLKASSPFFAISLVLGLITLAVGAWYKAQHPQFQDALVLGGSFSRLACAGLSITFYLKNSLWPLALLPIYPKWNVTPPTLLQFLPWPVLLAAASWFWSQRQGWGKHALFGLGFFLIMLAPFLGLNPVFYMSITWVMDHFLYIPIIGLIGLVVAALDEADRRLPQAIRPYDLGIVTAVVVLLAWQSHTYAGKFINQKALWMYTIEQNPDAWPAHNNLGNILLDEGRYADAIGEFKEVLRVKPDYAPTLINWGFALVEAGNLPEGIRRYEEAARLYPASPELQNNWGNALIKAKQYPEAISHFQEAMRLRPDYAQAVNNLGNAYLLMGNPANAITCYQEAQRLVPDYADVHFNWAVALVQAGRPAEAILHYQEVARLNPGSAQAHASWGVALLHLGRKAEAAEQFQQALRLDLTNPTAREGLLQLEKAGVRGSGP